jgi:hypothetical protein
VKYASRIPANDSLGWDLTALLTRPVGRPSDKPVVWYKSFLYQAASWKTARRAVARGARQLGELFPHVGCPVANLGTDLRAVGRFPDTRGTAEPWSKAGTHAVKMTRLSRHRFRSNEGRLWLSGWQRCRCPPNRARSRRGPRPGSPLCGPPASLGAARMKKRPQRRRLGVYCLLAGEANWQSWLTVFLGTLSPKRSATR